MLISPGRLTYGDPERRAIYPVLEAIEEGLDVDNLSADYRGVLSEIHDYLGCCIGTGTLVIPAAVTTPIKRSRTDSKPLTGTAYMAQCAKGPGGIGFLDISASTWLKLVKMKLPLVADVDRADRERLLEGKLGPRVLKQLRAEIDRYKAGVGGQARKGA